ETAVVGAQGDDIGANTDQGSAYVFVRSGTTWSQQQKLTASDGAASDIFGWSVAITGETAVVGARGDDIGANTDQGSAYVFVRSGTTWSQQQKLTASDGAAFDQFGLSVAISGETVVVGAAGDDIGAAIDQGSAYVFVRSGATWSQQQKLTASDGAGDDEFGQSVAISGETVVVGAFLDDIGANIDQGSVYVFVRTGATWSEQQKLTASDGAMSDQFGISVAISGETVVVGAYLDDVSANTNQGSAYVFVRTGTTWSQRQKLTTSDGAVDDRFGISVAISGETAVVGSYFDDIGAATDQGSAYVFVLDCICPTITGMVSGGGTICAGNSATVTVTISGGGTSPYTVTLNNGGGTQVGPSPLTFTVSPGTTTTYAVQSGIDATGCPVTGSGSATVTVMSAPTSANAGSDQTLCLSTPATLAANVPGVGTGNWSVVSGPNTNNSQFSSLTTANATFTPAGGAGSYTLQWMTTSPPCLASTDTVVITFNPVATVNAGPDQGVCENAPTVTLAGSFGGSATTATWSGGTGTFSPNNTTPNATYTPTAGEIAAGVVTLTYSTDDPAGPCPAGSDSMTVTISSCIGVMVADTTNNRIQAFDGVNWTVIGVGTVGTGNGQFRLPEAVTFDEAGRIYVADTGNNRIQWSTDGGVTWANFATNGTATNQVKAPQGLALDANGNLYVSDTGNGRVMRFNGGIPGSGIVIATNGTASGQVGSPRGLIIDATFRLFVTDETNSRILRINSAHTTVSGTSGSIIASTGVGMNQVRNPQGITIDGSGTLFVADTGNSRILRWANANPNIASTMALTGSGLGQVNRPEGVTVTQFATGPFSGGLFLVVGDTLNNRIQGRFIPTGQWNLVGAPNGIGAGVGQFRAPSKIR
ncbi:MAG TPA: hypothetical protein PLB18_11735, partial [Acidobacteriota bacterium]|nr:hypothetical protein [Acidobacteriota bacterium]